MKKDVHILRLEEILDLLETVEENLDSIEPPQTRDFIEGMKSGLSIGKKLAQRCSYEAYEYDSAYETNKAIA